MKFMIKQNIYVRRPDLILYVESTKCPVNKQVNEHEKKKNIYSSYNTIVFDSITINLRV